MLMALSKTGFSLHNFVLGLILPSGCARGVHVPKNARRSHIWLLDDARAKQTRTVLPADNDILGLSSD